MSGIRIVTVAPWRAAIGATFSASPVGVVSPLGSWPPRGAICVKFFGFSGAIRASGGRPSSAMP